jgi:hypothetical protein
VLRPWLDAFFLTQLVEAPLYAWLAFSSRRPVPRLGLSLLPSAVTHPLVFLLFPLLPLTYEVHLLAAETFAVLAEGLILRRCGVPRPFAISLLCNAASVLVGSAMRMLWGWP